MGIKSLVAATLFSLTSLVAYAAPFNSSFHNVDANLVNRNFSFYPNQGLGARTLSVYNAGNQVLAAGSFDNQVPNPWVARIEMSTQDFASAFSGYGQQGYRPRQISTRVNSAGQAKFTVIWEKAPGNNTTFAWVNMTDAEFNAHWNDLVGQQGYRVSEFSAYTLNGQRRSAAVFVKDGQGFVFYTGQTEAQFSQHFAQLAATGFYPVTIDAADTPQGQTYSAVWMKATGQNATYIDMTANDYQARFTQFSAQGFRLAKVIGYANGTKFAAIWTK